MIPGNLISTCSPNRVVSSFQRCCSHKEGGSDPCSVRGWTVSPDSPLSCRCPSSSAAGSLWLGGGWPGDTEHRSLRAVHSLERVNIKPLLWGPSGVWVPVALIGCEVTKRLWPPSWDFLSGSLRSDALGEASC